MPVETDLRDLSRRKVRYLLFRIQNGNPVSEDDGVKGHFESQDEFDGWHNFSKTWDVGAQGAWPEGHWVARPRKRSVWTEWQELLGDQAPAFGTPEAQQAQPEEVLEGRLDDYVGAPEASDEAGEAPPDEPPTE